MTADTKILINCTAQETRVAMLLGNDVCELHYEQHAQPSLVGNIYKGKVVRVIPGMQAAFIDIGEGRNGFLHARDLATQNSQTLSITDLLHQGQNIVVQVTKDGSEDKGAVLSCDLSMSSPALVYLPNAASESTAISKQITDSSVRERLAWVVAELRQKNTINGGIILRTQAEFATVAEIESSLSYLLARWQKIEETLAIASAPALLAAELPLRLRALRDWSAGNVESFIFDDQAVLAQATAFVAQYLPKLQHKLRLHVPPPPLFLEYGVESVLETALARTVTLASGANLIFDDTAAMTVVDVNTAAFIGRGDPRSTVLQTNLEAAVEIARQLRLRNISGIVIVDFIDMENSRDRKKLLQSLEQALQNDPVKTSCAATSALGLIEITRQRSRPSLAQSMQQSRRQASSADSET